MNTMNKDELMQILSQIRVTAYQNASGDRQALVDEAMKTAIKAVADTVVNRPPVLYAIENTATGEITFNARGGCYKTLADAEKKLGKMGDGFRLVEYRLAANNRLPKKEDA